MVMVTKVYKPNVKFMVEELERNPNVWTLDEASWVMRTCKIDIIFSLGEDLKNFEARTC